MRFPSPRGGVECVWRACTGTADGLAAPRWHASRARRQRRRLGPSRGAAPGSPALAQPGDAAVVLVPAALVEHAGVHDVAHGHVEVVGEEALESCERLVPRGLWGRDRDADGRASAWQGGLPRTATR